MVPSLRPVRDGLEGSPAEGARFFGVEEYAVRVAMTLAGK